MSSNPKHIFVLASGLTGIFSTGYVVTQIPNVVIDKDRENTKHMEQTTKQMEQTTKQMEEITKQMQETTKQMQCELDTLKLKRRWWW